MIFDNYEEFDLIEYQKCNPIIKRTVYKTDLPEGANCENEFIENLHEIRPNEYYRCDNIEFIQACPYTSYEIGDELGTAYDYATYDWDHGATSAKITVTPEDLASTFDHDFKKYFQSSSNNLQ